MNMTQMIEATFDRREKLQNALNKKIHFCGEAFEVDGIGTVWCGIQVAEGAQTYMRSHFRRTWKLNGKRIAADKLEKIVGL